MSSSRTHVFQAIVRALLTIGALFAFTELPTLAANGVFQVAVKDSHTHYALQASLTLQGPQNVSVRTNEAGRVTVSLEPGEYRIEVSAPLHKTLRTHTNIHQGASDSGTVFLDPDNLPSEELPENLTPYQRPGFTLLHGYIVDEDTGKPIEGATVRAEHANVATHTDSKGHYLLSIPTPVAEYPGGLGTDTLIFAKQGYSTQEYDNFGVAGDEMGGSANELQKGNRIHRYDATHKLMKEARPRKPAQRHLRQLPPA